MGFSIGSVFKSVTKIITAPIKIITKALSWIAPKPPEIPDLVRQILMILKKVYYLINNQMMLLYQLSMEQD